MTLEQHEIFNKMLDANIGCDHAIKRNDPQAFFFCDTILQIETKKLIDSMGQEAYDAFINQGKKLFADTEK